MKKSNQQGFTIIEVMIVLAIAALILLIVFLAIPALQRNSRNASRRSDASRVVTSISTFVSDNNGVLPGGATYAAATAATDAGTILTDAGTLGQLNLTTGGSTIAANTLAIASGVPASTPASADDRIIAYRGTTCQGTTIVASNARAIALLYPIEQGGGTFKWGCLTAL